MAHVFDEAPEPPTELGALSIGNAWEGMLGSMSKENSFKLLDAYSDAGGNFIDTANNYQDEQSEMWLGEWMRERNNRDELVIATKFTSGYRTYELGKAKTVNYSGNHKKSLILSVEASLKKLQTHYIDLLYLHWWDWTTSIPELMDSLHMLVQQGKILYLGVSDAPAWIVSAANIYAEQQGKTPFSVYQGRWNVMLRDLEREIIPMARHFGMALAPWDAIGGGKFQTKKQIEERQKNGEGLRSMLGAGQSSHEAIMSEALEKVAQEHGLTSLAVIALAYVIQKAPNVIPIIGGRRIEHLHDNIQALSVRLTDEQISFLESRIDFDPGFPSTFVGESPAATGKSSRMVATTAQVAYPAPPKPFVKQ